MDFEREYQEKKASELSDEELRLRALNHTKDKLLSIVGHDLRTAIGGMLSLVDMLDKRLGEGDVEEAKRLNGLLRRSGHDADDLLGDLVTWTRSHKGEVHFRLEKLDLRDLLEREVSRFRMNALEKDIGVHLDAPPSGTIRADGSMLRAILRNLLSNALKFSHPGGEVCVRVVGTEQEWVFEVIDSGLGMEPEVQELLFKIDQRKQKAGTRGESGSGLGLLLCEEFVGRHGGRLTCISECGEGTTFRFTIPELVG